MYQISILHCLSSHFYICILVLLYMWFFFFIKNVWHFIINALNDNHALLLFAERTEQKPASIYVDSGGCSFKGS